ncbi:hypothetical protein SELMODRAFT_131642 [Selaginella moellendorffii]|uniref:Pentacotripeptide-repeat region of PRORP domain-containing protein n=1 Tax=Selaginella moellendorffii TaxID=88036 RepID=D8T4D6_SELML|nr:pentatricopeptide repeat-containing protein At4g13650 [Selaginella moellendorffii]EFJ08552.1 hypothetical protein SELMODRAFT_131642 [Selaginella moellendorffii]|eukprot:XP_002990459.1 pentatricopeptide repeat-containing protein At4g13650 [Selaginella moellendorffii]
MLAVLTISTTVTDLAASLRACHTLPKGKELHAQIVSDGLDKNLHLANGIVHMYLVCKSVDNARKVFDKMASRDAGLWAPMMAAYARVGHLQEATGLFHRMLDEGVVPDRVTLLTVINACSESGSLAEGRRVHRRIQGSDFEWSVDVGTALVRMYAKCGSVDEARRVFDNRLLRKNIVSWTTMVSAYVERGCLEQALTLFIEMLQEGVAPNEITYVSVLNACDLDAGRKVHRLIEQSGLDSDAFVGNALIKMYRRCGSLEDASLVFDGIADRNLLVWNSMIAGYASLNEAQGTLEFFRKMLLDGWKGDKHTLLTVLDACAKSSTLQASSLQTIHDLAVESGLDSDTLVGTALVKIKSEQGDRKSAKMVFDSLRAKDLAAWNCMFSAYAKHGRLRDAMELQEQMKLDQVRPDKVTFVSILSACTATGSSLGLETGKKTHEEILEQGYRLDAVLGTALVRMYAACGRLDDAKLVFEKMESRDLISWTTMLGAYTQARLLDEASITFRRIQLEGHTPDRVALIAALGACTNLSSARDFHERIRQLGWEKDPLVANALLEVYSACGSLEDANETFDGIGEPSVISWNLLIAAHTRLGHPDRAFDLLRAMELQGHNPDSVTLATVINSRASLQLFRKGKIIHDSILEAGMEIDSVVATALVNFYGKCGDFATARSIFQGVGAADNVVTWNSTLAAYAQSGHASEALHVLAEMVQQGVAPTAVTFVSVLSVCGHAGVADVGCHLFSSLRWDYDMDPIPEHYGCMIDLLARGGWLEEARQLLKTMPTTPDSIKWMALLSGCHGASVDKTGVFMAMQLLQQNTQSSSAHIAISNLYSKI